MFPVEILLSRDVAPLSEMCIVSNTSSICSSSVYWGCVCGLLIGWHLLTERDRFVRFADVAIGRNSFIDGTNGFVHALVVCCGAGTTFAGSGFLFCIVLGVKFLAVGFDCLYLLPLFARWLRVWLWELMVSMKKTVSPLPVR